MGGKRAGEIELCYVDCFAGPWGAPDDSLEGTSIAVALRTMERCRQILKGQRINVTMRALFVERDVVAFQRLKAYLAASSPPGIKTECFQGDFVALRDEILRWCGRRAFTFFFIDPKGWTPVGVPILKPLLERPGSEFLINFMYDFVNRTASMAEWQDEMTTFLGRPIEQMGLRSLGPEEREWRLVHVYREGLKQCIAPARAQDKPRTAYVRVMDRQRNRPKYHLV